MRTFTSTGITHLRLTTASGPVEIGPSQDGDLHGEIVGAGPEEEGAVEVRTFGDELHVTSSPRHRGSAGQEARLQLLVPPGTDLTLVAGSGDLHTDVSLGRVVARCGSGDLWFAGTAEAQLHTGSGDITVLSVTGAAEVSSGSGAIRIDACSDVDLRTASGDVSIGRLDGRAEARLASGDFRLAATTGSVAVRTTSGDVAIGVAAGLPAWLDLHSRAGRVNITLPPTPEPDQGQPYVAIHARTGSGDIRISRAGKGARA